MVLFNQIKIWKYEKTKPKLNDEIHPIPPQFLSATTCHDNVMCWSKQVCNAVILLTLSLKLHSAETSDDGGDAETETPFTLL